MLFCFILHGFAFDYTDENGVTWTCSATYDESFARLTGASNYGAEVVVPEKYMTEKQLMLLILYMILLQIQK